MSSNQFWLNLNGVTYTSDHLKAGSFKSNINSFEQSTLNFCCEWLTNRQEFQLHTSGSTGTPKNIIITRKQMEASARLTIKALHLKPNYNALICLDTKYIAGQMMLVRSFVLGMNIVAVDPTSNPFKKIHLTQSLDFAALAPYQVQTILNSPSRSRLDALKCAIIGGAPLDLITKKELLSIGCECYATYGMTETISHIALQRLNGEHVQDHFEVLDEIEIGQDERGCLVIRAGYLGNKIITNDLIEIINTNKFRWLGRWDNIINSGGVKIMPEKIEVAVQEIFDSLELTNRFFVAGLPDEKLNQKVSLIIEGTHFAKDLLSRLEKGLREKMDRYEKPREIKFITTFKQTETGKVMRAETLHLIPARSHT